MAAIKISDDQQKQLIAKHRHDLRRAFVRLSVYGYYQLNDQFGVMKSDDANSLNGEWMSTGNPDMRLVFEGDEMFMLVKSKRTVIPATFTDDPKSLPKTIDISLKYVSPGESRKVLGIYEISGRTLKLSQGETGGGRPKEFTGVSPRYLVLERVR